FDSEGVVAVTGARAAGMEGWITRVVTRGSTLAVGGIGPGLRTYIAVRGGIEVRIVLGSRSFCQRGAFGGGFGRPLAPGDRLTADQPLLAQARPGDTVRFREVDLAEAERARRRLDGWLELDT